MIPRHGERISEAGPPRARRRQRPCKPGVRARARSRRLSVYACWNAEADRDPRADHAEGPRGRDRDRKDDAPRTGAGPTAPRLVQRVPNEADRRSYFLEVTPDGSEFLEAMEPILDAAEKAIEGELGVSLDEYRGPLERLRKANRALLSRD